MLKKRWPNKVVSDEGFEVRIVGRGTVIYVEGNREIVTNSEDLVADEGILLYRHSLASWTTPRGEPISQQKQENIQQAIESALAVRGIKLTVI